jgi:nitrite reductase/ring-hydroxylating ferredoxin subunit
VSSQDIGPLKAFPEGAIRVVKAGRREIGVIRWRGHLYAVRNVCAHQRGPVCRGWLTSRLTASAPGTMEVRDEAPVIACPWHGWEFDVQSGRALSDERYALRTYPVRVEQGRVVVELSA